jgi:hypothetical protein
MSYAVKQLEVTPHFDLELFMNVSQETRIGGEIMDRISGIWERWLAHAHVREITTPAGGYLLAWLDAAVEDEVDDHWEQAPSEAFMINALAQTMCMGLVHAVLPEVEEVGCAPAPHATQSLADALASEGLSYATPGEPTLSRRYAVVTSYPFKGGCELCALRERCPKAGGTAAEPASVTLPGFE